MDMRSKFLASTLAIGLGFAVPVMSAIGFPEVAIAQTVNDRKVEADRLLKEGDTQREAGKNDIALPLLKKALKIYQEMRDRAGEGQVLKSLGIVYLGLKQYEKASGLFQQSLSIARAIKNQDLEARLLNNLGLVYVELQKLDEAISAYQKSLTISRSSQNWAMVEMTTVNLGGLYVKSQKYSETIDIYQQAELLFREAKDTSKEARAIALIGDAYFLQEQYGLAIKFYQKSKPLAREAKDKFREQSVVNAIGNAYLEQKKYEQAIESFQEGLVIARETKNQESEAQILNNLGKAYQKLNKPEEAITSFTQSLSIFGEFYLSQKQYKKALTAYERLLTFSRSIKNENLEATILSAIAVVYGDNSLGDYHKSIDYYQQALKIAEKTQNKALQTTALLDLAEKSSILVSSPSEYQEIIDYAQRGLTLAQSEKNLDGEARALVILGYTYNTLKDYKKGVEYFQKSISIAREAKEYWREVAVLNDLALAYINYLDDYSTGLKVVQQALGRARETKNRGQETYALTILGSAYFTKGEYKKAIEFSQQALSIAREIKDRSQEAMALALLGQSQSIISNSRQDYKKAIDLLEEGLIISREIKDKTREAFILDQLPSIYSNLMEYPKAIELASSNLAIAKDQKNSSRELTALGTLIGVYEDLGDVQKTTELLTQGLVIAQRDKNRPMEGALLLFSSIISFKQNDSKKCIEFAKKSLTILKENQNPVLEAYALTVLGIAYSKVGESQKAIDLSRQSFKLLKKHDAKGDEVAFLTFTGEIYRQAGQRENAITAYRQAIAANAKSEIPSRVAIAQAGLARIYRDLKMPLTAITYYKQSLNGIEQVRQNIKGLPKELQNSFLQGIATIDRTKPADIYRNLADLLIEQGRIAEAQQVLELLKIQDLNDFTKTTRAAIPRTDLGFTPTEQSIQTKHNQIIAFGITLDKCRNEDCTTLQQQEVEYDRLRNTFLQFIQNLEAETKKNEETGIAIRTSDFTKSADKLANRPNTALIYPLVLKDKVRLLWMTQGKVSGSATCNLPKKQLNEHVTAFRTLISQSSSDLRTLKAEGKALYDCLIKPLAPAFAANRITNLIFIPDLNTSYIPLAALHDGTDYLAKTYTISNALSAELTNADDRLPAPSATNILGLGLTDAFPNYNALPNVQLELDSIIQTLPAQGIYPGTTFLNGQFTRETLTGKNQKNLRDRKIIHIATHGEFLPTDPKSSYLLLGNGEKFPIYQIQDLDALRNNTHLVVLSACKTGVMGTDSNGIEIGGINSYFLRDRAKAVLASLWNVDDGSTSLLMQNFYLNLSTGMSKPEALRQAQLNLLNQTITPKTASERGFRIYRPPGSTAPDFAHPYFWAAFTLTGNPN